MREQYKRLFNLAAVAVLLLSQICVFAIMWYRYFLKIDSPVFVDFYRRGNRAVIGVYMLMMIFMTYMLGGYKVGYLKITDTCISHGIAIFGCNVIEYFQLCILFHDYLNPIPLLVMMFVELAVMVPWVFCVRKIYVKLYPAKRMLYIYEKSMNEELLEKINTRDDKYRVAASVGTGIGLDAICTQIKEYEAVIIGDVTSTMRNDIMKYCFEHDIRAYVVPKISDLILLGATEINLFDTPLLLTRNYGLSAEQLFIKRIMDIVISLCVLVLFSPVMLILALAIKIYDRGPVFYIQERLTKGGKAFNMIKFRSMIVDSEQDGARLAQKNDSRVTPVGKVMRKLHLDELPQLFNVLKGDMAFVGPRPERAKIAALYKEQIPEFDLRLKVKAGLTGFAQVYGKYNTTPYDKLKLDLTYIEKYSLLLDIKIIFSTVRTLFQKDNTEGVSEEQVTALTAATKEE